MVDTDPRFAESGYAHPEVLVSTAWLAEHLQEPSTRIVESNEDVLLYDTGHIPGAVYIDWTFDIIDQDDPIPAQIAPPERFAEAIANR